MRRINKSQLKKRVVIRRKIKLKAVVKTVMKMETVLIKKLIYRKITFHRIELIKKMNFQLIEKLKIITRKRRIKDLRDSYQKRKRHIKIVLNLDIVIDLS